MKQIGTCGRVRIVSIVIGIAVMSAIGSATFGHTHDQTATAIALLVCAAGLAHYGRRILGWWWGTVMLGLDSSRREAGVESHTTS